MFFLLEFLFFALALATVAIAELLGRELAAAWAVGVTLLSLVARLLVRGRVPLPGGDDRASFRAATEEARWWRATLDSWAHLNRALLVGSLALLLWVGAGRLAG